ncbi:MAG TPA: single-stranded-DNA-specific exonuclease RecJ [Candidatus Paceibacterota bacterium]|nr:single-stranded-DNA-specific exonuclease RecJ [Candidatus Paceibacterota bacterium]
MTSFPEAIPESVREALSGYDDFTAGLLARRGITTAPEAEAFLSPSYDEHIGNPMRILNMPKAAARVARAIDAHERIGVWSDYDCDGIPGGVLFHDFLKKTGANFVNYIPHRHKEGFGLNENGIDKLHADGVTLLITIDCGIADVDAVAYASSLGIDVIITDHHLPGVLPDAYAIVDPKQDGETNAYTDFCGAGLAWKLVCAVLQHGFAGREKIPEGWEKWLLDMAGMATIADMVPLTGENRVIARYGLLVMRKSRRLGLQKLCKVARVNQRSITEDDVGFMLAPRINAASRMGNPTDAFHLLTTSDEIEADTLAKELERINRSRRAAAAAITRSVHERLAARTDVPAVIAMGDPEWRPGLLGLVANSVAEEYERPVFLWGREASMRAKGSCRAGKKGMHVVRIMEAAKDVFKEYGGHAASGGFTVHDDQVFFLEEKLNEALSSLEEMGETVTLHEADASVAPHEANIRLLSSLEKFAPFGMGNPKPVFLLKDVLVREVSWFGKSEEHLRVKIAHESGQVEAISFFAKRELGKEVERVTPGGRADLLANLEREQFTRGMPVRLRIVAIR